MSTEAISSDSPSSRIETVLRKLVQCGNECDLGDADHAYVQVVGARRLLNELSPLGPDHVFENLENILGRLIRTLESDLNSEIHFSSELADAPASTEMAHGLIALSINDVAKLAESFGYLYIRHFHEHVGRQAELAKASKTPSTESADVLVGRVAIILSEAVTRIEARELYAASECLSLAQKMLSTAEQQKLLSGGAPELRDAEVLKKALLHTTEAFVKIVGGTRNPQKESVIALLGIEFPALEEIAEAAEQLTAVVPAETLPFDHRKTMFGIAAKAYEVGANLLQGNDKLSNTHEEIPNAFRKARELYSLAIDRQSVGRMDESLRQLGTAVGGVGF